MFLSYAYKLPVSPKKIDEQLVYNEHLQKTLVQLFNSAIKDFDSACNGVMPINKLLMVDQVTGTKYYLEVKSGVITLTAA